MVPRCCRNKYNEVNLNDIDVALKKQLQKNPITIEQATFLDFVTNDKR